MGGQHLVLVPLQGRWNKLAAGAPSVYYPSTNRQALFCLDLVARLWVKYGVVRHGAEPGRQEWPESKLTRMLPSVQRTGSLPL
jgi:hypothetical protein